MANNSITPMGNSTSTWFHRWIYHIATGFMFVAVVLRSILVFESDPLLGQILLLLAAWLLFFIGSSFLFRRISWVSILLIGLETLAILSLLLLTHSIHSDFLAFLFAIVGMQVMHEYTPRLTAVVIGLSALLTFFGLLQPIGVFQALALTITYTAGTTFLVVYIGSAKHALVIQERQRSLAHELLEANRKLESYSQTVKQLSISRERQRLAQELHDSVTQTTFSMTLATQSARLLLHRDRKQVAAQLDRLDELAQNALSEMQVLISHLAPKANSESFLDTLRRHLADRQRLDNLSVELEVEGEVLLTPAEEASLFRIAQEGLNNVVKHARTTTAVLRLHLAEPYWMEVEDRGAGFDTQQAIGRGRMGLAGMRERAAVIGWSFMMESAPGEGTRIRIQKGAKAI